MARTIVRQSTQVRKTGTYTDNVAAGSTLESNSASVEDDLNAIRSQINRILDATGAGDWYADVATVNSKKRGVSQLNTSLNSLEIRKVLGRRLINTDIEVDAGQNWQILSVAGSEAPSQAAAVATTQLGAVVAQSATSGGAFAAHELTEIAGFSAIRPKNLVAIRDASTGQVLKSSGRDIYGLLQYESTGVDGGTFNDTSAGNRVKISFVRQNAAFSDIEACPVADIEGLLVNYSYVIRTSLESVTEDDLYQDFVFFNSPTGGGGAARGTKTYATVTADTAANANVGGVSGGTNLDAQLPDLSAGNFLTDYDVYVNGQIQRPGADASANNDYYPGTSLANGQLMFEFAVTTGDVICVIPYV